MKKTRNRPSIPDSEFPKRWEKVQQMMVEKGLGFLVAYADDRATFGPAHARWLANFPVHRQIVSDGNLGEYFNTPYRIQK